VDLGWTRKQKRERVDEILADVHDSPPLAVEYSAARVGSLQTNMHTHTDIRTSPSQLTLELSHFTRPPPLSHPHHPPTCPHTTYATHIDHRY
jgi:hypothetical protein